jgi:small GTP-binding protein
MPTTPETLKYIVIGSSGVGKTAILTRLENDVFRNDAHPTIGVDFVISKIDVQGQSFKLHIWDTAGQERFKALAKSYFRCAMGVILVFDITERRSFDDVNQWLMDVHSQCEPNVAVTLVGNKRDLESVRAVSLSEATDFARFHHINYVETSARTGENITDAFYQSVLTFLNRRPRTADQTKSVDFRDQPPSLFNCQC